MNMFINEPFSKNMFMDEPFLMNMFIICVIHNESYTTFVLLLNQTQPNTTRASSSATYFCAYANKALHRLPHLPLIFVLLLTKHYARFLLHHIILCFC